MGTQVVVVTELTSTGTTQVEPPANKALKDLLEAKTGKTFTVDVGAPTYTGGEEGPLTLLPPPPPQAQAAAKVALRSKLWAASSEPWRLQWATRSSSACESEPRTETGHALPSIVT